ncbi:MAG: tetratricopeptide repeat protein [Phormidesmis sp. CAN_BIN44]|nr:tetratricopeptide repeat protein [Phormidesmis sp. CAN_BIN44]
MKSGSQVWEKGLGDEGIFRLLQEVYYSDEEAEKYLDLGNEHFKIENYKEAISCYRKAIEVNPNYAKAYIRSRLTRRKLEDYGKAILIEPEKSGAYVNRSVISLTLNDAEEAMRDLNKAVYLDPSNATVYTHRASVHLFLKDYELAIEDYNRAIQILPGRPSLYCDRADAYLDLGDKGTAIEDYKKAAEIYNRRQKEKQSWDLIELVKQLEVEVEEELQVKRVEKIGNDKNLEV